MNLKNICDGLKLVPTLKVLYLQGNPISLAQNYKKYILSELKDLRMFDSIEIQQSQSSKSKQSSDQVQISDQITIDFIITVAGDITGTMIDEELWDATGSKVTYDNLDD